MPARRLAVTDADRARGIVGHIRPAYPTRELPPPDRPAVVHLEDGSTYVLEDFKPCSR